VRTSVVQRSHAPDSDHWTTIHHIKFTKTRDYYTLTKWLVNVMSGFLVQSEVNAQFLISSAIHILMQDSTDSVYAHVQNCCFENIDLTV